MSALTIELPWPDADLWPNRLLTNKNAVLY